MNTLYHYCSIDSFFNILRTKNIRLTDTLGMNDSREGRWADLIINPLISNEELFSSVEQGREFLNAYHLSKPSPFIFCFSEHPDILSQWRAYSNDGTGVCIGFSSNFFPPSNPFAPTNAAPKKNTRLEQVLYVPEDTHLIKELLKKFKIWEESQEVPPPTPHGFLGMYAASLSAVIKNPAFYEEKEWRLIHSPILMRDDQNRHRPIGTDLNIEQYVSGNKIRTYFEYPIAKDGTHAISEIWLGPKCELTLYELSLFFSLNNYGDIPVKRSKATYR
ncbi:DUF2971 domain-containing protein [Alcanivoracaceae bacterium MT1]